MSLVITIYWIYRGLRRGLYPALNILFVFFVPLLITLNYYDLLFGLVGRIKPDTTQTTRETISFVGHLPGDVLHLRLLLPLAVRGGPAPEQDD